LELKNFVGFQRAYPVAIQPSWVIFNSAQLALDPGMSKNRPLTVTVPANWAGMENVTYNFKAHVVLGVKLFDTQFKRRLLKPLREFYFAHFHL
jgi:hypothetical protein